LIVKILVALLIVGVVVPCAFPFQGSKPIPPGIREADKLPGPADIPPINQPQSSRASLDVMQKQARELALLAQTIPSDVSQVINGTLPKDMGEKLKRIEKLSKALRGELTR
jgi:hypothetical protein